MGGSGSGVRPGEESVWRYASGGTTWSAATLAFLTRGVGGPSWAGGIDPSDKRTEPARAAAELEPDERVWFGVIDDARAVICAACQDLELLGRLNPGTAETTRSGGYTTRALWLELWWVFEDDGAWRDQAGGVSFERACAQVHVRPEVIREALRRRMRSAVARADAIASGAATVDPSAKRRRNRARQRAGSGRTKVAAVQ